MKNTKQLLKEYIDILLNRATNKSEYLKEYADNMTEKEKQTLKAESEILNRVCVGLVDILNSENNITFENMTIKNDQTESEKITGELYIYHDKKLINTFNFDEDQAKKELIKIFICEKTQGYKTSFNKYNNKISIIQKCYYYDGNNKKQIYNYIYNFYNIDF